MNLNSLRFTLLDLFHMFKSAENFASIKGCNLLVLNSDMKGKKLRVVELFAGVGGFRLGLEGWKGNSASSHYKKKLVSNFEVVWSNQWEPSSARSGERQEANMVYHQKWPDTKKSIHYPHDLNTVADPKFSNPKVNKLIPDHDLLVGGFPCQDYSVAGVNTKGLEGKKGVLWWNIHKILKAKKPKYLFLENVDRLLKSPTDKRGRDFAIMLSSLWQLGYDVEWKVINAGEYGMPQRRRRVYILAYHKTSPISINKLDKWTLEEGLFAQSFPSLSKLNISQFTLSQDLSEITKKFNQGKFLNSGSMSKGRVWMTDFIADCDDPKTYSKKHRYLGDVLDRNGVEKSFFIDKKKMLKNPLNKPQLNGFKLDKRLKREGDNVVLENEFDKWIYLKGRKAEERVSSKGVFYYKEGPLSLTDDLEKPSRTIITSEGGPGASRFKHLIFHKNKYRRLTPMELERLNMFPDKHTEIGLDESKEVTISDGKRAFFMGNALVIGVVEQIGIELNKRVNA